MAYPVTPTNEVDPISRIEGHLGIAVVASGGVVTNAFAHGNLWRGFENFLLGRDANDAITFTQRICGVCPVPHGLTATFAADTVLGYSAGHITFAYNGTDGVPAKAVLIRNLVLSAEFLMSSITHFYHLAAPSYVQGPAIPPWTPYFDNSYYHVGLRSATGSPASPAPGVVPDAAAGTIRVWDAVIISYVRALRIRRLTFEAGALFAGRMPMTSCYVAGGVTNDGTENLAPRIAKFKALIREVGLFIINEYVPIALVLGMLYQTFDSQTYTLGSVAGTSTTMKASNRGVGGGLGRFLAWGAFPNLDDSLTLPGGLKDVATPANNFTVADRAEVVAKFLDGGTNSVKNNLKEDIAFSRYGVSDLDTAAYTGTAAYPGDVARTKPVRANGYTYMKAPRWNHTACEVGPFARLRDTRVHRLGERLHLGEPAGRHQHPRGGVAGLARVGEHLEDADLHGAGEVGVVEQDVGRLAPLLLVDALHGGRGGASYLDAGPGRAGEGDHVQARVGGERRDRVCALFLSEPRPYQLRLPGTSNNLHNSALGG